MIKQVMNWIKTHRYCLAGLYMLVFLSGFFLLELHEPSDVHIIHCAVDDLIPFNGLYCRIFCGTRGCRCL